MKHAPITRQRVPEVLIAALSFPSSERDTAPDKFAQLAAVVGQNIAGPRMMLYHHDEARIEIAIPVAEPIQSGAITSRVLPGGEMICITHIGPHDQLTNAWSALDHYLRRESLGLSNHPTRVIYREEYDNSAHNVTEIQRPLMLPVWLDRLANGLERVIGQAGRDYVMEGAEKLANGITVNDRTDWVIDAIQRLDNSLADCGVRAEIMMECTHRFPEETLRFFRREFQRLNFDVRAMIDIVHPDPRYHAPELVGNVLYVSKVPADRAAYEQAASPVEKRAYYCHCVLMHNAIRAEKPVSRTYCYCGAGWFKQIWEGILMQPVRVEVAESVLQGDDRCRFAIHLPDDVL